MTTTPERARKVTRWGLVAVTLALGVALVGSTLRGYLGARGHARSLVVEQAAGVCETLGRHLLLERAPPNDNILTQVLDEHSRDGLRYIAVVDGRGSPMASAGNPSGEYPIPAPGVVERRGARARLAMPLPPPPFAGQADRPPHPNSPPPGPAFAGPPPDLDLTQPRGALRPPPPLTVLLELEPLLAEGFVAEARTSLGIACVATLVLGVVALVLGRASRRAERAEAELVRQEHLASLGEMSAVLAHELKNPLAIAKGHAQLLAERVADDPRQARWASEVVGSVERLEALTRELLEFARTGNIDRQPASPRELLEAAAGDLDPSRIDLEARSAPEQWPLDPRRIRAVLTNLLENALDASPEGGRVQASARVSGGSLVFLVRDHGKGFPPGDEERIFQPFFSTKARGTGLGLAIARRIVHLHGGRIEASSCADGGAELRVTLPR